MRLWMKVLAVTLVTAAPAAADELSRTGAGSVTWMDTPFGVQAAPVLGDFTKGKHITLIRFKAGTQTPPHVHSVAYTGIVVQGRGMQYEPGRGGEEVVLEPGSFWSVPANLVHVSGCLPGEDCVFALYQDAAFDFVPRD